MDTIKKRRKAPSFEVLVLLVEASALRFARAYVRRDLKEAKKALDVMEADLARLHACNVRTARRLRMRMPDRRVLLVDPKSGSPAWN